MSRTSPPIPTVLDTLLFSTTILPGPVVSPDPFGFFTSIPNRPLFNNVFPFIRFSPGPCNPINPIPLSALSCILLFSNVTPDA